MGILKTQFCENLRLERQKRKWSQENIADMLEMSPSGYAKIERGETEVSLDKVEEIADKLEIGVFELLKINLSSQQVSHSNCYNYTKFIIYSPEISLERLLIFKCLWRQNYPKNK